MKLVIEIDEDVKKAFDCAESNDLKGCYYDHGGVIGNAIKRGTPLPKGHGRLIDADILRKDVINHKYSDSFCEQHNIDHSINLGMACIVIGDAPTIIEASEE